MVTTITTLTGSRCTFGNNRVAAIIGRPRWLDPDLTRTSEELSAAHALAQAYKKYGQEFLEKVRGPFSFAVIEEQRLLLGIDRLGQHTLYYSISDGSVIFGSTASAVLALSPGEHAINEQGIYNYFYFHMIPSPQSVFTGLKKLPAAHYLAIEGGRSNLRRYWSPSFQQKPPSRMAIMGTELKEQLRSAVSRAVPEGDATGSFLSGGLDSSTVTGMLSELTDRSCPAYSIGFDEEGYDEMEFARNSARHFGVKLREYYVTPDDVVNELPKIATSYDEPFGNSSALPAYFCALEARKDGIASLLAGDGGDEIFAGNGRYAKQQLFEIYGTLPTAIRRGFIEPLVERLPNSIGPVHKLRNYIAQANIPLPDRLQSYNYLNRISPAEIFSPEFLESVDTMSPITLQRETYHSLENASDLSRMLYLDWQYTLSDNDLRKVSRMCDIAGVRVSYPMLDEDLVDFSCTIPDNWKLKRRDLRHFYKKSLTGWLPQETITKKKQGFGLPFGLWMQRHRKLNEIANDSLLRLSSRGYFREEFINRLIRLHREEHAAYYGELIWILTIFDLWLEGRSQT